MANPLRTLLDRCSLGFTMPQKIGITVLGVLWVISPLDGDFIPLLGWIDDGFVILLLRRVWTGPTLPTPTSGGAMAPSNTDAEVTRASHPGRNGLVHRPAAGSRA